MNPRQFSFLMFNYVVGFGFVTTIGQVIKLGGWGIFVFFVTAFIAFGVMLIFAHLSQQFPNTHGSSYGYAKMVHKKPLTFLQGWNQYVQGPVISVSTPLFLETILKQTWPEQHIIWKMLSIAIFIAVVLLSLFEFKNVFKIIKAIALIKWAIIFLAFILTIVVSAHDGGFSSNWIHSEKATASVVTGSVLSFIFAFGGVEGVAAMSYRVETKSFRKLFFLTFLAILSFYFVCFLAIFGIDMYARNIDLDTRDLIKEVYNICFGVTGIILFSIGLIANKSSAIINGAIINAELLVPLSHDGYFPAWIQKQNAKDVNRRAIILSASISLVMMALFQAIEIYVDQDNPFLNIVSIGTICFFVQYFFTAVSLLKLLYLKRIEKLPVWELFVIVAMMLAIAFILLTQMIPPVVGDSFSTSTIIKDVSFFGFMGIGFTLWGVKASFDKYFDHNRKILTASLK